MSKFLFIKNLSTTKYKCKHSDIYEPVSFEQFPVIINLDAIVSIEPCLWRYDEETMKANEVLKYSIILSKGDKIDISPEEYKKLCKVIEQQRINIIV